jgi:hypothetical protein
VNNSATPVATDVVAKVVLPLGTNFITLSVSDRWLSNQQTITVAVITPAQAVEQLLQLVNADAPNAKSLADLLSAAMKAIDRGHPAEAIRLLKTFEHEVNVRIARSDPALARTLSAQAQAIISALAAGNPSIHTKFNATRPQANGPLHLSFTGTSGQAYIIEASTNLTDWQMIGVANDRGDGTFDFDDSGSTNLTQRFYKVIDPQ